MHFRMSSYLEQSILYIDFKYPVYMLNDIAGKTSLISVKIFQLTSSKLIQSTNMVEDMQENSSYNMVHKWAYIPTRWLSSLFRSHS